MPWEKRFDIDQTLNRAMEAFWARGFEATSMQDLVDVTGVNRASLYATYGDKRDLFLAALRRYDSEVRRRLLDELGARETPPRAVAAVFDKFIRQVTQPDGNWGCFLINSALELAPHDPEIAAMVNSAQDDIEAFFLAMIRKGQQSGDFPEQLDATYLARQGLVTVLGLVVMIRSRPEEAYLHAIRDGFLSRLT
ncbi:TetR/AcrR family transcriptional regulator [Allopontixanthobacter sp.]|uniref:TetR/AcrR family transcriptional regulator n=1 Tax=Allopontixanthobacter sp. TaxID=2906452 RepID=UPI002ABB2912|nr:TetR/AcrR family transcriptional regulator [Allopontixanthobacter sp.]MDZ4307219.1 TetR/AcrR family transcriptional regulator [Allopontixanthobacter sp.]